MAEIATAIHQGLGPTANEVDPIIIDYVVNVLKDETFDFGPRGDLAYDAVGPLLLNVGCFPDAFSARAFFQNLAARFGDAHAAASAENVRSLGAPMRMGEGMAEQALLGEGKTGVIQAVAAEGEEESMYFVTERDLRKLERNKRKDERQRMDAYEAHVKESEAILSSMPLVTVSHGGDGTEGGAKDIHLSNFTVTVAGKDLISDASITLAFGRRYGLIGRNGTGKTTLLKHMAMHAIDGIPRSCQVLHVEQEVVGDDTSLRAALLPSQPTRRKGFIGLQIKNFSAACNLCPPVRGCRADWAQRDRKNDSLEAHGDACDRRHPALVPGAACGAGGGGGRHLRPTVRAQC
ncbi:unnamed protein product [Closterium sp. Naga37s-1]|nr:unnamed protein product [Closterium sp. Naga37s-1]